MTPSHPFAHPDVASAFASFPRDIRQALLTVRDRVFELAADTQGVGPIEETLKWGQPAYLTSATKAGTTLRLGMAKDGRPAVFVHCQTSVLGAVGHTFPHAFDMEGTRAASFPPEVVPEEALDYLILSALTYHRSR